MKLQTLIWTLIFTSITLNANAHNRRTLPLAFLTMDGIHADGTAEGTATEFASGLSGPIDVTNDSQGNLYVTNFNNGTVSKISPQGEVSEFATVLTGPSGITIDAQDNLYVSHFGAGNGLMARLLSFLKGGC
jgi:DNA-binding beta-propeller fold protein YncE